MKDLCDKAKSKDYKKTIIQRIKWHKKKIK